MNSFGLVGRCFCPVAIRFSRAFKTFFSCPSFLPGGYVRLAGARNARLLCCVLPLHLAASPGFQVNHITSKGKLVCVISRKITRRQLGRTTRTAQEVVRHVRSVLIRTRTAVARSHQVALTFFLCYNYNQAKRVINGVNSYVIRSTEGYT